MSISYVGARGDGVADGPVFVPMTLPGERVRAGVSGERGRLLEVLEASPERIEPACPHAGECGGCAFQMWTPSAAYAWKRGRIETELARYDVRAPVGEVLDAAASGRRRAVFHAVRAKSVGFVFGFARRAGHSVFDQTSCMALDPRIDEARAALRALAELALTRSGRIDLAVTATHSGLDVAIDGVIKADDAALIAHAVNHDWARLSRDNETLVTTRAPTVSLGGVPVALPAKAFLQATQDADEILARLAVDGVEGAGRVLDLYAGLGTLTLPLARRHAVHAVDTGDGSLRALERAARAAEGLKPVSIERRDLAKEPFSTRELTAYDAVVLDPPRAGALEQAKVLSRPGPPGVRTGAGPSVVVYVSCNPATFARDAAELCAGGWRLDAVAPVDQFGWSAHVELVGRFTR